MFNNMWDVKEPKHYSKRVGREIPVVVAVLCVVNTGPMLIAVTTITEMVILYKYVEMMNDDDDLIMPVKRVRINTADAPWMTQHLKSLIRKRQKAFHQHGSDSVQFKFFRNAVNRGRKSKI